ncbi:MAG: M20/M25/M40 family metallo-hydrolase [Candidatus Aminicenantales bacterium]
MKKHLVGAIILITGFLSLQAQMPPMGPPLKVEDIQKILCLVDKPEPVPDKYKTGFATISSKDTMAMLTYLSSDWMEGRETGTSGYALAADYVVSQFKMWGIKPAGDFPLPAGFRMRFSEPTPPAAPERTYFQNITFKEVADTKGEIKVEVAKGPSVKSKTFASGLDYQGGYGPEGSITAPVVFVGYGISEPSVGFDELKGLNLKGKIVLVLTEAPGKDNPQSPFKAKKELNDKYFPGPGPMMMMRPGGGPPPFNKIEEINKLGPAAVIQVANTGKDIDVFRNLSEVRKPSDDKPIIDKPRKRLMIAGESGADPMARMMGGGSAVTITREIANVLLEGTGQTIDDLKKKIETTMKPASFDISGAKMTLTTKSTTALVRGLNVLGMIEGSDPVLKDEYFVVGAHFDHLGRWENYIYNGSDDNCSGSVGVMAIAKAIASNPVKPKRTVIFALWTGEEEGLYGSRYYVQNPVFPIEKTVGYLNYDMISRAFDDSSLARAVRRYNVPGAEDLVKKIRGDHYATVSLTGNTDFVALTREMNKYVGLDLALNESPLGAGFGGSDHSSFAQVKIPFVYYMTAMTQDYHQTSDSSDKANPELLTNVIRIGYLTSFAFADK